MRYAYIYTTICLVLINSLCNNLFAQKKIRHTNQQWIQFYHQHSISNKHFINYDIGVRKIEQNILAVALSRIGFGYRINPSFIGVTGFALFNNLTNYHITRVELRPYQEISLKKINLFSVNVVNRFRVEYRYFTNYNEGVKTGKQNNFRFRYRIGFTKDLYNFSSNQTIQLSIANELFINAGNEITYNTFDNNRIIAGISFKNKELTYSMNYNFQYGNRSQKNLVEQSNIIWFTITLQTRNNNE